MRMNIHGSGDGEYVPLTCIIILDSIYFMRIKKHLSKKNETLSIKAGPTFSNINRRDFFAKFSSYCAVGVALSYTHRSLHASSSAGPSSDKTGLSSLLPENWNPEEAADNVLGRLIKVTGPNVKGAHDAEMAFSDNHAFIVWEANDERPGEHPAWPEMYVAMSIVNMNTMEVEDIINFAHSEQAFENETLPVGACFVPRIIRIDESTLRCYFTSEQPDIRQSQYWYRDFDIQTRTFSSRIYRVKLKTSLGTFPMQPKHFYADAVQFGFGRRERTHGLYIFDSFKEFDGNIYTVVNNFPNRQNALAKLNVAMDTFEIIGHFNEPQSLAMSEAAVSRLPDETWMAIARTQAGEQNYAFTESKDGRAWSDAEFRQEIVPNGSASKPTFDRFNGVYYLGWQENTRVNGAFRSVFNVDVSRDGRNWQRKYRFMSKHSFQYPTFHEKDGAIWVSVTQGYDSEILKERIMFGKLEEIR